LRTARWPRAGLLASGAGLIEVPHRFVQTVEGRVEIGAGLLKRCMAEHVLHVVHGPTGLGRVHLRGVRGAVRRAPVGLRAGAVGERSGDQSGS
jgi:hypothetical protein